MNRRQNGTQYCRIEAGRGVTLMPAENVGIESDILVQKLVIPIIQKCRLKGLLSSVG